MAGFNRPKGKTENADLTKSPQQKVHITSTTTPVRDARQVLSAKKKTETTTRSTFPKIIFTNTITSEKTTAKLTQNEIIKTTQTAQTEPQSTTTATQTTSDRSEGTAEICVSCVDSNICIQEEETHNKEPPTMGTSTQLEASHEMITEGLVATLEPQTHWNQRKTHYCSDKGYIRFWAHDLSPPPIRTKTCVH